MPAVTEDRSSVSRPANVAPAGTFTRCTLPAAQTFAAFVGSVGVLRGGLTS
jgi:hypothetical protein